MSRLGNTSSLGNSETKVASISGRRWDPPESPWGWQATGGGGGTVEQENPGGGVGLQDGSLCMVLAHPLVVHPPGGGAP